MTVESSKRVMQSFQIAPQCIQDLSNNNSGNPIRNIEVRTDPLSGEPFVLWKDVQIAFKDADFVIDTEDGHSIFDSLTDDIDQLLKSDTFRRMQNKDPQSEIMPTVVLRSRINSRPHIRMSMTARTSIQSFNDLRSSYVEAIFTGQVPEANGIMAMMMKCLQDLKIETERLNSRLDQGAEVQAVHTAMLSKINDMSETMIHMQQSTLDQLARTQAQIQALLTQTFELHEYQVPRLFIILPKVHRRRDAILKPFSNKFRLYFLCECGAHTTDDTSKDVDKIHLANHPGYDIEEPTEFFEKYGRHVLTIMRAIQMGAQVASFLVPHFASSGLAHELKEVEKGLEWLQAGVDFYTKENIGTMVDNTIHYIEDLQERQPVDRGQEGHATAIYDAKLIEGAELRQLTRFLSEVDTDKRYGNLYRKVFKGGHVRWVCRLHFKQGYREEGQKIFLEALQKSHGMYDEDSGVVTVTLTSPTQAKIFYDAFIQAHNVHELRIDLNWELSLKDVRNFTETIHRSSLISLNIKVQSLQDPLLDLHNSGRRYDPLLQLLAEGQIQYVFFNNFHNFFGRVSCLSSLKPMAKLRTMSFSGMTDRRHYDAFLEVIKKCQGLLEVSVETPDNSLAVQCIKICPSLRCLTIQRVQMDSKDVIGLWQAVLQVKRQNHDQAKKSHPLTVKARDNDGVIASMVLSEDGRPVISAKEIDKRYLQDIIRVYAWAMNDVEALKKEDPGHQSQSLELPRSDYVTESSQSGLVRAIPSHVVSTVISPVKIMTERNSAGETRYVIDGAFNGNAIRVLTEMALNGEICLIPTESEVGELRHVTKEPTETGETRYIVGSVITAKTITRVIMGPRIISERTLTGKICHVIVDQYNGNAIRTKFERDEQTGEMVHIPVKEPEGELRYVTEERTSSGEIRKVIGAAITGNVTMTPRMVSSVRVVSEGSSPSTQTRIVSETSLTGETKYYQITIRPNGEEIRTAVERTAEDGFRIPGGAVIVGAGATLVRTNNYQATTTTRVVGGSTLTAADQAANKTQIMLKLSIMRYERGDADQAVPTAAVGTVLFSRLKMLGAGAVNIDDVAFSHVEEGKIPARRTIKWMKTEAHWKREAGMLQHLKSDHYIANIYTLYSLPTFASYRFVSILGSFSRTLESYMATEKLTSAQIRQLTLSLSDTLRWCHEHHAVHLNVRPASFYLEGVPGEDAKDSNGQLVWKLWNFGHARFVGESVDTTVTTVTYAAPEILQGRKQIATETSSSSSSTTQVLSAVSMDLWSLGLIIYELHTRKAYFSSSNFAEFQLTNKDAAFEPALEVIRQEDARKAIRGLMEVDPEKRYAHETLRDVYFGRA
ncbi:hypothetical protein BGZ83_008962 [Gryganskiella cystojenkinii]|nr:hypothetical protein BGZ83_008962 [Gryganskiella cystojenkinii]